jgi:hypothetical protein
MRFGFGPFALGQAQPQDALPHFSADVRRVHIGPDFEDAPIVGLGRLAIAQLASGRFRFAMSDDRQFATLNGRFESGLIDSGHFQFDNVFVLPRRNIGGWNHEATIPLAILSRDTILTFNSRIHIKFSFLAGASWRTGSSFVRQDIFT